MDRNIIKTSYEAINKINAAKHKYEEESLNAITTDELAERERVKLLDNCRDP
jgi:hypothetical protein